MRIFIMMIVAAAAHAATPRNLGFTTSAQTLAINTCSNVVEAQTQDYAFNPANVATSMTLTPSGSFSFFSVTLTQLRASYASFVVQSVDPNLSVNSTNSDDLRNFYRLYKRTSYAAFLTQAQNWRDFYVNSYSHYELGGSNRINTSHVYMI